MNPYCVHTRTSRLWQINHILTDLFLFLGPPSNYITEGEIRKINGKLQRMVDNSTVVCFRKFSFLFIQFNLFRMKQLHEAY